MHSYLSSSFGTNRAASLRVLLFSLLVCLLCALPPGTGPAASSETKLVPSDGSSPQQDPPCAWQSLAPLPAPRAILATCEVNGRVLVFGGSPDCPGTSGFGATAEVYEYLYDSNTWVPRAPMPRARADRAAAVVDGKVYLFGGDCCVSLPTDVYDPETDSWSSVSPLPTQRGELGVAVIDDIVYAVGGWNGGCSGVTEAYNPATDTWTTLAPLPAPRSQFGCVAVGGRVYAIGGYCQSTTMFSYDPATNTWTREPDIPGPINWVNAVAVGSKILVAGGAAGAGGPILTASWYYDTVTKTWSEAPPLCEPRAYSGIVVANGRCLLIGGYAESCVSQEEVYALDLDDTPPTIPFISARRTPAGFSASWTSSDPETGISEYRYAIGTSPTDMGGGYLVDWKSTGTTPSATETGLNLQHGQTYYWYVKAKNGAGVWSAAGVSNGSLHDATPPGSTHYQLLVTGAIPGGPVGTPWPLYRFDVDGQSGTMTPLPDVPLEVLSQPTDLAYIGAGIFATADKQGGPSSPQTATLMALDRSGNEPAILDRAAQPEMARIIGVGWDATTSHIYVGTERAGLFRFGYANGELLFDRRFYETQAFSDVVVSEDGSRLLAANYGSGIRRFSVDGDGNLAEVLPSVSVPGARLTSLLVMDARGDVYVSDAHGSNVHRYHWNEDGTLTYKGAINVCGSVGIAFSPDGLEMFVTCHEPTYCEGAPKGIHRFAYQAATDSWDHTGFVELPNAGAAAVYVPDSWPLVTDDGDVAPNVTSLHATWEISDPESGIAEYQYAIGTSPRDPGSGYLVAWKSAGTATKATEPSLALQVGQMYYWYVKARNGAGLWSETGVSDGIQLDLMEPDTSITSGPAEGGVTGSGFAAFTFTGTDNLTPPEALKFQTKLDSGAWTAPSLQTSASYSGLAHGTHTFSVRAVDAVGNVDPTPATRTWTADATPPSAPTVTTRKVNEASLVTANASAADAESGISGFEYAIVQCPDLSGAVWASAGAGPELVIGGLSLTPGERYYLAVRAMNGVGTPGPASFSSAFIVVGQQILAEDFEGAFETVDWPRNDGACVLDTSPIGKARVPSGWAYAGDDSGRSTGFGQIAAGVTGNALLLWQIQGSYLFGTPELHFAPGQYVLRFWAASVGARTGGVPGPVGKVFIDWVLLGAGSAIPQEGYQLCPLAEYHSPLPQAQKYGWTEFAVPLTVVREGTYRIGLGAGASAAPGEEGQAFLVDDLSVYRAGAGASVTARTTSSVSFSWNSVRPGGTTADWGTTAMLGNLVEVPGMGTSHSLTIDNLPVATGLMARLFSSTGLGCTTAFDSFVVPTVYVKESRTQFTNPGFETSTMAGWTHIRRVTGPWTGYWGITPHSGQFFVAVGGNDRRESGVLRTVLKVNPGWRYKVSAWAYTKVTGLDPTNSRCYLGLDPGGWIDPYAPGVIKGAPVPTQGEWAQVSVEADALTDELSVYGYMEQDLAAPLNLCAMDDFSVIGDGSAPTTPAVIDDGTYIGYTGTLNASWTSADSETGIEEYQYAIGTSPTDPGSGYLVGWKSSGTVNSATETGLVLSSSKSYYWYVRARNGVGQWSEVGVSNGVRVDTTPPTTPVVADSGQYTASLTQLSASWASIDPETGVVDYQYAIGTSPTDPGTGYTVPWTSVAGSTQTTATGLSLTSGSTYYFYVKAKNGVGLWSAVGASDGMTVAQKLSGSPGQAKREPDNTIVGLQGVVVTSATGQIPGRIYVEAQGRSSGIAVTTTSSLSEGDVVDVVGRMTTNTDGERVLNDAEVIVSGTQTPLVPVSMNLQTAAGGPWFFNATTGAGQRGITEPPGKGLNSTGLLMSVFGWVSDVDASFVYVNDGAWPGIAGVRVSRQYVPAEIGMNDYMSVTGISSMRRAGLAYQLLIRPRKAGDIQMIIDTEP